MFQIEENPWIFAVNSSLFLAKISASPGAEQALRFALWCAAMSAPGHHPSD